MMLCTDCVGISVNGYQMRLPRGSRSASTNKFIWHNINDIYYYAIELRELIMNSLKFYSLPWTTKHRDNNHERTHTHTHTWTENSATHKSIRRRLRNDKWFSRISMENACIYMWMSEPPPRSEPSTITILWYILLANKASVCLCLLCVGLSEQNTTDGCSHLRLVIWSDCWDRDWYFCWDEILL